MKISSVSTLHCKAGWRIWSFIRIQTTKGITGWSEITESNGSPKAIAGAVDDLRKLLVGEDPLKINSLYHRMQGRNRQSLGGAVSKAIAGVENALLDIKGKHHGVPVYQLFGGEVRKSIPLYWSHFGTSRVRAAEHCNTLPITGLDDKAIECLCQEAKDRGYTTIKTNIPIFNNKPFIYHPGFGISPGGPECNLDGETVTAAWKWIKRLRDRMPNTHIILDLNYNFTAEAAVRIASEVEGLAIEWFEYDTTFPGDLEVFKGSIRTPLCSCENLIGVHQYLPFITEGSVDVVSIDVMWNGMLRSLEIAQLAAAHGKNVTPHNHYSNLATFMSAQFCAMVPNLRIMEYDVDDVRWRDDLLTAAPLISDGVLHLSDRPGWGADINEVRLNEHRTFI